MNRVFGYTVEHSFDDQCIVVVIPLTHDRLSIELHKRGLLTTVWQNMPTHGMKVELMNRSGELIAKFVTSGSRRALLVEDARLVFNTAQNHLSQVFAEFQRAQRLVEAGRAVPEEARQHSLIQMAAMQDENAA